MLRRCSLGLCLAKSTVGLRCGIFAEIQHTTLKQMVIHVGAVRTLLGLGKKRASIRIFCPTAQCGSNHHKQPQTLGHKLGLSQARKCLFRRVEISRTQLQQPIQEAEDERRITGW